MNMLNQKQKIIMIIIGGLVALIIGYYYISSTKDVYNANEFTSQALDEEKETEEILENTIVVHVTGAVNKQGVVKVKENARINDVIEEAGGTLSEADLSKVNLAYIVEDGQKIYIPYEKEGEESIDDGEIVTQDAGNDVLENDQNSSSLGIININTATQKKLTEIPGVRNCYCFKNCYI